MRNRIPGNLNRDENCRDCIGENKDAILGHLGIGNALHATEHRIDEHDAHANGQADRYIYFEKPGENDANAAHLSGDIGEGYEHQANNRDNARCFGVITLGNEFRHGEFTELAQVRRKEQSKQYVSASPPHQVHGAVVTEECDQSGHGYERRSAHPVGRCRHAVCKR